MPVELQVISIFAGTNGYLDDLPVERAQDFEAKLLDFMHSRHGAIGDTIRDTGKLEDDTVEKLRAAVEEFKQSYLEREEVEQVETVAAEEGVPKTGGGEGETGASTKEQPAAGPAGASSDGEQRQEAPAGSREGGNP